MWKSLLSIQRLETEASDLLFVRKLTAMPIPGFPWLKILTRIPTSKDWEQATQATNKQPEDYVN